jgi:hypothetical protein
LLAGIGFALTASTSRRRPQCRPESG